MPGFQWVRSHLSPPPYIVAYLLKMQTTRQLYLPAKHCRTHLPFLYRGAAVRLYSDVTILREKRPSSKDLGDKMPSAKGSSHKGNRLISKHPHLSSQLTVEQRSIYRKRVTKGCRSR